MGQMPGLCTANTSQETLVLLVWSMVGVWKTPSRTGNRASGGPQSDEARRGRARPGGLRQSLPLTAALQTSQGPSGSKDSPLPHLSGRSPFLHTAQGRACLQTGSPAGCPGAPTADTPGQHPIQEPRLPASTKHSCSSPEDSMQTLLA